MRQPLTANQVAKLRKDQARKLHMALELAHPELIESKDSMIHGSEPRKLTKREQELAAVRAESRMLGFTEAKQRFEREAAEKDKTFQQHGKALHLETLKTVRDLASAYGQMMGEVARAMQSEKDQL